jgi:hypothetical protein
MSEGYAKKGKLGKKKPADVTRQANFMLAPEWPPF